MNETRDLIIGIDFGKEYSQICYYDRKAEEPRSLPVKVGSSQFEMPTCLCLRPDRKTYCAGLEAEYFAREKGGFLAGNLYEISAQNGPAYKFVGTMAVILSGCMVLVYCIPGSGGTLIMQEWMMVGAWSLLGVVFYAVCKVKYKEKFGSLIEIISDEDAASLMPEADDKELDLVIDAAIDRVLSRMTA